MKGLIFNVVEEVVTELYDADTWDDLLDAAGVDGAYTALGNYDDDELIGIVDAASTATGNAGGGPVAGRGPSRPPSPRRPAARMSTTPGTPGRSSCRSTRSSIPRYGRCIRKPCRRCSSSPSTATISKCVTDRPDGSTPCRGAHGRLR